jgi:hemerythrin-like domain-containing protein
MSHVTDAMHQHHQQLLDHLSEHVRLLTDRPYDADPRALATFLKADLMPHAAGEERSLYPVVDPLIKAHGTATATMSIDHQFIGDYVRMIDELGRAIAAADPKARPALLSRLARYGVQIEAIFRLHLRKEEEVYLPLFEKYVAPDEQQRVLDAMHETGDD